jgi:hypothetical protein
LPLPSGNSLWLQAETTEQKKTVGNEGKNNGFDMAPPLIRKIRCHSIQFFSHPINFSNLRAMPGQTLRRGLVAWNTSGNWQFAL